MKKITFILAISPVFILFSCSKGDSNLNLWGENLIWSYMSPNDMVLCYTPKQDLYLGDSIMMSFTPINNKNRIYVNGKKMTKSLIEAYEETIPIQTGETMDSLMTAHNDLYWQESKRPSDGSKGEGGWGCSLNHCSYKSFTFNITSDTDYDTAHPAGTSLNDIMSVHTTSPRKFIESRYKDYKTIWEDLLTLSQAFNKQKIEEFNAEGENILFPSFKLSFDTPPAQTAVHTLTVTITLETGRVVSCSIPDITIYQ